MLKIFAQKELWFRSFGMVWKAVPGHTVSWLILLIAQGLLPGVTIYLTKLSIDSFMAARNSGSSDELMYSGGLFLLTGLSLLLAESMRYVTDWVRTSQAEHFGDYVKDLMHVKSVEVDFDYYDSAKYHDLQEQARGESQSKPLLLLENFGAIIQNAITLATFAALLAVYGWMVPPLLLIGALPSLLISLRFDRRYFNWWRDRATDRRWLFYYDGMLSHAEPAAEMRLFGLGERFRGSFRQIRDKLRSEKLRQLREQSAGKLAASTLAMITGAIALTWIALRVYANSATLGDLAVFYQVFSRGQGLVAGLLGSIGKTVSNSLYLESLFAYLDLQSRVVSPVTPTPFPKEIKEGVRFNNVTFRYPGAGSPTISNFCLFIPAQTQVAIVGLNGAGKSTLVKLLCRFYDPDGGSIEIDGIDIREFELAELRRNISVLFQFPMRFQATAADNIAFGDGSLSPEPGMLQSAAEQAGAHDFISRLPNKYHSILGRWFEEGSELSGGEWQRLALARAYFRKAQLIVLDEPTSFMDSWAEADWFDRFRELASNSTGLIITHRFTIAMRADVIHVLDDGRLLETGTHGELVANDGFYATSWKSQMQAAGETEQAIERAFT